MTPEFSARYSPCLRWKLGEYQAVMRLDEGQRAALIPLIELPEIGWDFEEGRARKHVSDHIAPFSKRVLQKWGAGTCFIDFSLIDPDARLSAGEHPLAAVLAELSLGGCDAIPVSTLGADDAHVRACRTGRGRPSACVRMAAEEAASKSSGEKVEKLLRKLRVSPDESHLVLDLGVPNFDPIDGFERLCVALLSGLPLLHEWESVVLLAGSFPETMAVVHESPALLERSEWLLYKRISATMGERVGRDVLFGDYCVSHPVVQHLDMRFVKPSASIRYSINDAWLVMKGKNVRDHGYSQYAQLCADLVKSPHFAGAGFSWGDAYIQKCARGAGSTGNLTTWRCVGTNHHLARVVADCASLT